ncbi:uncharacterized protein KIAA1755 homolog [Eudromia elegans]
MDAGSLDAAVQGALRALYPPFEATAPTLLGQVFRLLESSYGGDGLRCLLEFLIPAQRLFERVRRAACAPYPGCVFLHEGWPLCLREKVVVHLAPLNPLLLRAGDFYLQAEPCAARAARITLKRLSHDLRTVQETPLPEATYAGLFTNEWLEGINCEQEGAPLRACLVASEEGVAPLPWSRIATPEFVQQPHAGGPRAGASCPAGAPSPAGAPEVAVELAPLRAPGSLCAARTLGPYSNVASCSDAPAQPGHGKYPGLIKVEQLAPWPEPAPPAVPSLAESLSQDLAGEYVELVEPPQEKLELLVQSLPLAQRVQSQPCSTGLDPEGPCAPSQGRGLSRDPRGLGPRGRCRDSYLAALQNPVSFGPGLMAAILEEPAGPGPVLAAGTSTAQQPGPRGSPTQLHCRQPSSADGAPGQGDQELLKAPACLEAPGSSHRFSFLKSPRLRASSRGGCAADQGTGHLGGPWKKMSAIYSPRMSRAKATEKGPALAANAAAGDGVPSSTHVNVKSHRAERGALRPTAWQDLHAGLLLSGIACLPGGTDKLGRALIQVSTSSSAWNAPWCSADEVAQLLLCLCSVPSRDTAPGGLTVIVDARKQPPSPVLYAALRAVQSREPGTIRTVLLLAEKEPAAPHERLPGLQVETLPSLRALGRYVDSSQVTRELDGSFPYCHGEWVQFFQRLQPFVAGLRQALELLRSCIRELCGTAGPAGPQEAAARIARHGELMGAVLSEPQLAGLQRDGGAVLGRLRREAARLGASPHVRSSLEAAEGLYEQLEEELHGLVSTSNSCLQHLEVLREAGELQAELRELRRWLDREAAAQLEDLSAQRSPDGSGEPSEGFEELLAQAMMTRLSAEHRETVAGSGEDPQGPRGSFPGLSRAVALSRLREMVAQVRGARGGCGPGAWAAAQRRHRDARRLLREVLAELQRGWAADATGRGQGGSAGDRQGVLEPSASSPRASPRNGGAQDGDAASGSAPGPGSAACPGDGGSPNQAILAPVMEQPSRRGDTQRPAPARARHPRPEAAQYFQVSSWSSVSSEDSDSHVSAEESLGGGPAPHELPANPTKAPRILYLEEPLRGDPAAMGAP